MPKRIISGNPAPVYLAEWREHFGLTQQQFADTILGGINKNNISRWENSARDASVGALTACADALKIPIVDLFRPPTGLPSIDAMIARAPPGLQADAVEMVKLLLKDDTEALVNLLLKRAKKSAA